MADTEADTESDTDTAVITMEFDYKKAVAHAVMSDGRTVPADRYLKGDNGFAVGFWKKTIFQEWETEIVNGRAQADGTLDMPKVLEPPQRGNAS